MIYCVIHLHKIILIIHEIIYMKIVNLEACDLNLLRYFHYLFLNFL